MLVDVIPNVGQAADDARRQRRPVDVHVGRLVPLVRLLVVAFDVVDGGDAVEAAYDEDHVVDDFDGEVAARIVHVGDLGPSVRRRVEFLAAAHPGDAVEAADYVYVTVVGDAGDAGSTRSHRIDQRPLVDRRVVHFRRMHAFLSVEAAGDVDFVWGNKRNRYYYVRA